MSAATGLFRHVRQTGKDTWNEGDVICRMVLQIIRLLSILSALIYRSAQEGDCFGCYTS